MTRTTNLQNKMLLSSNNGAASELSRRVLYPDPPAKRRRINFNVYLNESADENEDHLSADIVQLSDSESPFQPNQSNNSNTSMITHPNNHFIRPWSSAISNHNHIRDLSLNDSFDRESGHSGDPSLSDTHSAVRRLRRRLLDNGFNEPPDLRITISNMASSVINHDANHEVNNLNHGNNENNGNDVPPALEIESEEANDQHIVDLTGDFSEESENENQSNQQNGEMNDDDIQILENIVSPDNDHHNRRHQYSQLDLTNLPPSPIDTRALYANLDINESNETTTSIEEMDRDDDDVLFSKIVKPKLTKQEKRRLERDRQIEQIEKWIQDDDGDGLSQKVRALTLTCPICTDTMKHATSTYCGHLFCESCLREALSRTSQCPLCQKAMTVLQTHRIYF